MLEQVAIWGRLVKFSHSVFALPFALAMAAIVARDHDVLVTQMVWIIVALVSARTCAMAFNRLIDRDVDARNPRTATRELPAGVVRPSSVIELLVSSGAIFFLSAGMLGLACLLFAPLVLCVLLGYSFAKRFTRYSHLVLGLGLSLAPGGVWFALTNQFAMLPVWMMLGVLCWVAGFDIIYSCQDVDFDRDEELHSLPAAFGVRRAITTARLLHLLSIALLCYFGAAALLGVRYFIGLGVFSIILLSQHLLVSPSDLSRADRAFFTRNGLASVVYLGAVLADVWF